MATTHTLLGSLTGIYTTAYVPVGTVFFKPGSGGTSAGYVFTYNAGADTFAAGDVASMFGTLAYGSVSTTAATVTDITDGTTIRPWIAGVALSAVPTTNYGWLWFAGYATHAITTDGNVVAKDLLTVTDGAKIATREVTAATAHQRMLGVAFVTDSSTTLSGATLDGNGIFAWAKHN